MNRISYIKKNPTPDEFNYLRESVGWKSHSLDIAKTSLDNSIYSVLAFDDKSLIGMGRVIGDNAIYYYIQDVIVMPDYQNRGIGSAIMEHIINYLESIKYTNKFIALMSACGKENFYRKFGFVERPNKDHGAGMVWKK